MPRLEDQIAPEQLLASIRSGALKADIIKEFRTNDRDLAQMLQTLFRKGEMTREEFNNFFKGISLRGQTGEQMEQEPGSPPPEAERQKSVRDGMDEEAETKPQGSVSKFISGLWRVSPPPEKPSVPLPGKLSEASEILSAARELSLSQVFPGATVEEPGLRGPDDRISASSLEADHSGKIAGVATRPPGSPARRTGKSGIGIVLKKILTRLDAIEARLSRIEKKLDIH